MSLDYGKLIEAAILAPTPDNNQPWRFEVRGGKVLVFLDPSRTLPSDVNGMFDLIGIGAAVENAGMAALEMGYQPHVEISDGPFQSLCDSSRPVATIEFRSGGEPDPLYAHLAGRHTCRKHYSTEPIPKEALDCMSCAAEQTSDIRVDWVTDRPLISELAGLLAQSDLIRFQYEPFHNELFHQLRFTAKDAEQSRDGLDVRTLELPPGGAWLLRQLKPWKRMKLIHALGLGRLLTASSMQAVKRSGAVGLLSVSEQTVERLFRGGMAFERLWLTATSLGFALQPLGSLPIFLAHWRQLGGSRLATQQQARVRALSDHFDNLRPELSDRVLQIMFRVGKSATSCYRSARRKAGDVLTSLEIFE